METLHLTLLIYLGLNAFVGFWVLYAGIVWGGGRVSPGFLLYMIVLLLLTALPMFVHTLVEHTRRK